MDPFSVIAGLGGSLISGIGSMFGQSSANRANMAMVQQQEAFQQQMSNTAYTRATADMKNAGLNPMMMFGSGSAASTPSGAIAPMGNVFGAGAQGIGTAVNSALSSSIMTKTVEKLIEEISTQKATTANIIARTATEKMRPAQTYEDTRVAHTIADTNIARGPQVGLESELADVIRPELQTSAGRAAVKGAFYGKNISDTISPISSIVSSALGARNAYWKGKLMQDEYRFPNRFYGE